MDHSGHHHEGHRASTPDQLQHPLHGSYAGHVVPGVMFIAWASYWLLSVVDIHLRTRGSGNGQQSLGYLPLYSGKRGAAAGADAAAGGRRRGSGWCGWLCGSSERARARNARFAARSQPFRGRPWYPLPFSGPLQALEPVCKFVFPFLGVLIELYIGWGGWRPLLAADGHFAEFHAGNWAHALMYAGFAVSGTVDLIGYFLAPLPEGTEQGFLALAFLVETLLMGMHAKPNELDQLVHTLLTWVMVACVAATAAELAAPRSLLLALLRPMLVMLQGTWFWHVGAIMFLPDQMRWDMNDMAAVMFVPPVFCLHLLLIALGTLTAYLFMSWLYTLCGVCAPAPQQQQHLQLASKDSDALGGGADSVPGVSGGGGGGGAGRFGGSASQQQQPPTLLQTQLEMSEFAYGGGDDEDDDDSNMDARVLLRNGGGRKAGAGAGGAAGVSGR